MYAAAPWLGGAAIGVALMVCVAIVADLLVTGGTISRSSVSLLVALAMLIGLVSAAISGWLIAQQVRRHLLRLPATHDATPLVSDAPHWPLALGLMVFGIGGSAGVVYQMFFLPGEVWLPSVIALLYRLAGPWAVVVLAIAAVGLPATVAGLHYGRLSMQRVRNRRR